MTGRVPGADSEQEAADDELDSAAGVLVWNGMVASIHRLPCSDASAKTPTRPAEATEPVSTRPSA